jgi:cytochrome b
LPTSDDKPTAAGDGVRLQLWDLPTRLFHWLLVLAVGGALVTGLLGGNLMVWHGRIGLLILGLIAFRIVWGFIGSTTARFVAFFPTPGRLAAYLKGTWQGLGHNPLGAISVLVLLGLMLWQASSGLFSNDDIAFEGPLVDLVDKSLSDRLAGLHRQGLWVIAGFVGLHVAAIVFYVTVRGDDLLRPMIRGWKVVPPGAAPLLVAGWLRFVIAVAIASAVVWVAAGGLLSPPPPPPPTALPAW